MENKTPDLSKIVSAIMENPDLIERISALATEGQKSEEATEKGEPIEDASVNLANDAPPLKDSSNRKRLLYAFKPYLSTERAKAIDSMLTIADILGAMKAR